MNKLKNYWIIISSAAVAILYFLLTLSREKSRDARNNRERIKLSRELDHIIEVSDSREEAANEAYKEYKDLLDRHPDIADKLK